MNPNVIVLEYEEGNIKIADDRGESGDIIIFMSLRCTHDEFVDICDNVKQSVEMILYDPERNT